MGPFLKEALLEKHRPAPVGRISKVEQGPAVWRYPRDVANETVFDACVSQNKIKKKMRGQTQTQTQIAVQSDREKKNTKANGRSETQVEGGDGIFRMRDRGSRFLFLCRWTPRVFPALCDAVTLLRSRDF